MLKDIKALIKGHPRRLRKFIISQVLNHFHTYAITYKGGVKVDRREEE